MTFEDAWPLLEGAAELGDNLTKEEAIAGLQSGAFLLFTRERSAALVFKQPGLWRIGLAGGDLSECLDIEAEIDVARRVEGVERLQIIGRPGWAGVLNGYRTKAVVLEKS